jgi:anhydro-N-acetylmuramic acid kinase
VAEFYIGLMSGTSLDGVDGVLADAANGRFQVLHHAYAPFEPRFAAELLALNSPSGVDELHRGALAANALAKTYAQVVQRLLAAGSLARQQVRAIGAHGQTVRHRPQEFDGTGYTIQLNNPALLAELTGISVVADFRSRDVAAGGQGAPLVPAFHQAVFGRQGATVAALNLGGISNLTVLPADGANVTGFDCGPGNALMDSWCLRHTGKLYDDAGAWAGSGKVSTHLLQSLLSEPYFAKPPPKSTGRDLFHADWLAARLAPFVALSPVDVQATLTELTAQACAADVQRHAAHSERLVVCGGGALNQLLMRRLQALLPTLKVCSSQELGLPPLQVEAAAFAWLARKALLGEPGNLEKVTGAKGARVLGAIYPA